MARRRTTSHVTGAGSGNLAETAGGPTIAFQGLTALAGAANNQDNVLLEPSGSIADGIDGGAGGFDIISYDGGTFTSLLSLPAGPQSGTLTIDFGSGGNNTLTLSSLDSRFISGLGIQTEGSGDTVTITAGLTTAGHAVNIGSSNAATFAGNAASAVNLFNSTLYVPARGLTTGEEVTYTPQTQVAGAAAVAAAPIGGLTAGGTF